MADANLVVLDATKGVYRHVPTGFTVHDIYSVADAIKCNGVLCYNSAGDWAWAAGRDLRSEVIKLGNGGSLSSLAQGLLRMYKFAGSMYHGAKYMTNGNDMARLDIPSMMFTVKSSVGLRIFGVVNNTAAGRGISPSLADGYEANNDSVDVLFKGWLTGGGHPTADDGSGNKYQGLAAGDNRVALKLANIIGRAQIAIPMRSWPALLQAWKTSLPNSDKPEVQSKAAEALSVVTEALLTQQFGVVPTVLASVVLFSDGTAALDNPEKPSCTKYGTSFCGHNTTIAYDLYRMPSLPEVTSGWWQTNPIAMPPAGAYVPASWTKPGSSWDGLDDVAGYDASFAIKQADYSALKSIDGVPLFNILGGLFPRAAATGENLTTTGLISKAFENAFVDTAVPGQLSEQSSEQYAATIQTQYDSTMNGVEHMLPSTWAFAGQPAFIATMALNAYLHGSSPKVSALTMGLLMSGYYNRMMRRTAGARIESAAVHAPAAIGDMINYVNQ